MSAEDSRFKSQMTGKELDAMCSKLGVTSYEELRQQMGWDRLLGFHSAGSDSVYVQLKDAVANNEYDEERDSLCLLS